MRTGATRNPLARLRCALWAIAVACVPAAAAEVWLSTEPPTPTPGQEITVRLLAGERFRGAPSAFDSEGATLFQRVWKRGRQNLKAEEDGKTARFPIESPGVHLVVYSSEPLGEMIEVIGNVRAHLYVASSAATTDFTVKLVDVYPDGRAINIADTILRTEAPAEQVQELTVDVGVTANAFGPGHRIRVEIASSNFPTYERNLNAIGAREQFAAAAATQRVFHDHQRPSAIILPIVD